MPKYLLRTESEFEIEADNEDEAFIKLEDDLGRTNSTANNEFWNNMNVEVVNNAAKRKEQFSSFRVELSKVLSWLEDLTPTGLTIAKNDINDKIKELEEKPQ